MEHMNADQNFSRPGAVDLSALAAAAAPDPNTPAGGNYSVAVTEQNFEQIAQQSVRYPVIIALVAGGDAGSAQVLADVTDLVNQAQGRLLLGVVDVNTDPRIAQALQVSAVPTVVALIAGQLAPLFQGTRDRPDIKAVLDQVIQVAAGNGLTGRAAPQGPAASGDGEQAAAAGPDPRFAAADEALSAGDFAGAVAEFDKLLRANPADAEAKAGRAQASLLARSTEVDDRTIARADAAPDDLEAQFAAADLEVLSGNCEAGFNRLIDLVRRTSGDDREQVRARLVELFETQDGADPVVKKARRALSMALF